MANDAATTLPPSKAMKLAYAKGASAPLVHGRRSFMEYRDLGVTSASDGRMRAQLGSVKTGMTEPTGWHYHVCEGQFVYTLKGWVTLEFEDGTVLDCKAGDSVFIPGGMRHNEIRTSDDFQYLEISVPAAMGTVPCEPPARKA
jgi:quercetin dioxygenase-like cupin family protein